MLPEYRSDGIGRIGTGGAETQNERRRRMKARRYVIPNEARPMEFEPVSVLRVTGETQMGKVDLLAVTGPRRRALEAELAEMGAKVEGE